LTALLWFRRDLRLADNLALRAALDEGRVVPVFCLDDRLLGGRHASGPRTQFLLEHVVDPDRLGVRRQPGGAIITGAARGPTDDTVAIEVLELEISSRYNFLP
jgi:deoxyribodipyrimidine photo-lyase